MLKTRENELKQLLAAYYCCFFHDYNLGTQKDELTNLRVSIYKSLFRIIFNWNGSIMNVSNQSSINHD